MAVFRVEKNSGYTVMSNHHLRNRALSLKAKGLLSQMLSLPEDWDYTLQGLARINRESIDAIRQAIRELEQAGYIQRSRERDEKGRLRGADYVSDLLGLLPFAQGLDLTPEVGRILNSKKVSDHHAIIPTSEFVKQGFTGLAESECKLMNLVCSKLLCAIAEPHEYETVTAVFSCAGNEFTAKG